MRLFTPQTARDTLQRIRPAAETMSRLARAMSKLRPAGAVADSPVSRGYFQMVERLSEILEALRIEGVQVKDLSQGLVDFPAKRAGRIVLLCWKVGEPDLGYWHEPEAGFAGRQPLDEDGPWEDVGGGSPVGTA
jgi:hypothetical protein